VPHPGLLGLSDLEVEPARIVGRAEILDDLDRAASWRLRRSRHVAVVLPNRLAGRLPVVAGERLELSTGVDVVVRRDDVAPAGRGIHRPGVGQVAALEVAVVSDRRLVRDVGVVLGTRRMADRNLLLVVLARGRDDGDRGERRHEERGGEERA